jgi:hypothetical protein
MCADTALAAASLAKTLVQAAIAKGVAYLESAQLPSGEIPMDTSPTPDMSGECVRDPVVLPAALAARALSITPSATRVLARAFDFLEHEMDADGLWRHPSSDKAGYDDFPHDVDDTSIATVVGFRGNDDGFRDRGIDPLQQPCVGRVGVVAGQ